MISFENLISGKTIIGTLVNQEAKDNGSSVQQQRNV